MRKWGVEPGYRCPPRRSQFKPGESGNYSGRRKRRRSFATDFFAALDALIPSDANKTKQQAIAEYLADAALSRDAFALKLVVALATSLAEGSSEDDGLTAEQAQLMEDFAGRQEAADSITSSQDGDDHALEL